MNEKTQHGSYGPTEGLTYDTEDPRYWDRRLLDQEVYRALDLCQSCRLCFKYCDSFPTLFRFVDEMHDGAARELDEREVAQVMDQCFQCKLCEVQCPYTPREGHEFQLDFPRLVHRYHAVRARGRRPRLRDRMLGDPDRAAQLARLSCGLANVMNRLPPARWFMEKAAGVHHGKLLPDFAATTFERWAHKAGRIREEPRAETVLFQTCYVQNNEPQIGRDALEVLDINGVDCACVRGLVCCGMPAWEHGDLETLRQHARRNLDVLMPFVENGAKVLAINPTCAMMMRREYPELLAGRDRERCRQLAEAVRDPCEYLWSIRGEPRFCTEFKSTPGGAVAYHAPCHLRALGVGFKGRDLLRKIPGVNPSMVMECSAHDGTYAMKVGGFEASQRLGRRAFDGMQAVEATVWATECPLAAIQFQQHAGVKAMHPISILARAYRPDGFPTPVSKASEERNE